MGIRNTLEDLNDYLFESLERVMDDDLTDEEFAKECKRAKQVSTIAGNVIRNASIVLRAETLKQKDGVQAPRTILGDVKKESKYVLEYQEKQKAEC